MKSIAILVFAAALSVTAVLSVNLALGSSPAQTQKTYGPGWVNWAHVGLTEPIAQALSGIEGNVGAVYYLNAETGVFLRYAPGRPEISNLTTMDFGQSYLMLLTAPTTMTLPTEATFLATPTACPAVTPCPDCPSAADLLSEACAGVKAGIETSEILLDIAEEGLLIGMTESEVRAQLTQSQQSFEQNCQGVPLAEPSLLTLECAVAAKWKGSLERENLYAPDPQNTIWINQFDDIVDEYCMP
jgi:hypothetical protein